MHAKSWICLLFQMKRRWKTLHSTALLGVLLESILQRLYQVLTRIDPQIQIRLSYKNTWWVRFTRGATAKDSSHELRETRIGGRIILSNMRIKGIIFFSKKEEWNEALPLPESSFSFRKHPIIWAIKAGKGEISSVRIFHEKTQKKAPVIISFITHQAHNANANANGRAYSPPLFVSCDSICSPGAGGAKHLSLFLWKITCLVSHKF